MGDYLAQAADVGHDYRNMARLGFDRGEAERLLGGAKGEDVRRREQVRHVMPVA